MNPWWALVIFFFSILDDILCVLYLRRTNAPDKKLQAGLLSGLLTGLISVEVLIYTSDSYLVIPNMLGSAIGTPLAIWADERWPAKKARDSKGKFKKSITAKQEIIETEKGM
jgi:hypothetical protein